MPDETQTVHRCADWGGTGSETHEGNTERERRHVHSVASGLVSSLRPEVRTRRSLKFAGKRCSGHSRLPRSTPRPPTAPCPPPAFSPKTSRSEPSLAGALPGRTCFQVPTEIHELSTKEGVPRHLPPHLRAPPAYCTAARVPDSLT